MATIQVIDSKGVTELTVTPTDIIEVKTGGTLTFDGDLAVAELRVQGGTVVLPSGRVIASTVKLESGILTGAGTIDGDLIQSGGTLKPSNT